MVFSDEDPYILGGAGEGRHEFRMNDEEEEAGKCQHRRKMVKMNSHQHHTARNSRSQTRDFIFMFPALLIYALLSPSLLPFSIYSCSLQKQRIKTFCALGILFCFVLFYFYSILQVDYVDSTAMDNSHLCLCYFQR